MGLDYSQKRLLGKAMHAKNRKLQMYAFWTGFASMLISLVHVLLLAGE